MKKTTRTYLPAAGRDWLLPLYDSITWFLGVDKDRRELIDRAAIKPGDSILDIGCGTGTLVVLVKHLYEDVEVVGLDPDPKALARAKKKAEHDHLSVQFDRGFSDKLPYPNDYFARVFSSFMFHHLESGEKRETLIEVRRVLKPGGSFYLLDFVHSESQHNNEGSFLSRWIHSSSRLKDNSDDQILTLMNRAGFVDFKKISHRKAIFAHLVCYKAAKSQ